MAETRNVCVQCGEVATAYEHINVRWKGYHRLVLESPVEDKGDHDHPDGDARPEQDAVSEAAHQSLIA